MTQSLGHNSLLGSRLGGYAPLFFGLAGAICCLTSLGCQALPQRNRSLEQVIPPAERIPNGQHKTTLPAYVIEPPDILLIDALKVVPKPPYRIQALDIVSVKAQNVYPDHPIDGNFQVESGGTINLGVPYSALKVAGMTVDEVTTKLQKQLEKDLVNPSVSISLAQTAGTQQIAGEHLVTPDGTVNLGIYGQVYVAGLTLAKAREKIEQHLAAYLESPQVTVDVQAYNSKVYYVILDGAGTGDRVIRLPITGGETVLDAMAEVGGMNQNSSRQHVWIARPAADGVCYQQRLPVNWEDITGGGSQATNYQMLPGDRLYVAADQATALNVAIGKAVAPLERASGVILLGTNAIRNLNGSFSRNFNNSNNGQ